MTRTILALSLLTVVMVDRAWAQHNHNAGHGEYQNWSSLKQSNCCNNDDCGTVDDADVLQTPLGTMVAIENQWCPVEREHWIIKGRSPDFSSFHACIGKSEYYKSLQPCQRLLCFSGKAGG